MFNLPQDLTYSGSGADGALGTGDVSELDPEEASFQSSFSKLGASESRARDPVADVPDAKRYASAEIAKVYREKQAQVGPALQQAQQSDAAAFNAWAAYMASNGYVFGPLGMLALPFDYKAGSPR
jgi:exportin-2 (importin alpha re-exporter)